MLRAQQAKPQLLDVKELSYQLVLLKLSWECKLLLVAKTT
jgi:hypothetical protein